MKKIQVQTNQVIIACLFKIQNSQNNKSTCNVQLYSKKQLNSKINDRRLDQCIRSRHYVGMIDGRKEEASCMHSSIGFIIIYALLRRTRYIRFFTTLI